MRTAGANQLPGILTRGGPPNIHICLAIRANG
jgi:hypothetical protein